MRQFDRFAPFAGQSTSRCSLGSWVLIGRHLLTAQVLQTSCRIEFDSTVKEHIGNEREFKTLSLTSIVWLIAFGKFLMVHEGVSFSGGSCDEAYDSVRSGITT